MINQGWFDDNGINIGDNVFEEPKMNKAAYDLGFRLGFNKSATNKNFSLGKMLGDAIVAKLPEGVQDTATGDYQEWLLLKNKKKKYKLTQAELKRFAALEARYAKV